MRFVENGAAGGFINAAGLHANHAVFHDVHNADAVFAAELIQGGNNFGDLHLFAVDGGGHAFFKSHGNILTLFGSFLRRGAKHQQMFIVGLVSRILQLKAFVTDMPQIAVAAVAGISGEGKINAVLAAVLDLLFAGV